MKDINLQARICNQIFARLGSCHSYTYIRREKEKEKKHLHFLNMVCYTSWRNRSEKLRKHVPSHRGIIQMHFAFRLLEVNRDCTGWYISYNLRIVERISYVVYYSLMLSFLLRIIDRMQALIFKASALHVVIMLLW